MVYHIRNSFELFEDSHFVNVHGLSETNLCVNYRESLQPPRVRGKTCFDIQVTEDVCYILWIELEKSKRGRGFGWQLYESIHNFASDFGCVAVRQTPSGCDFNGKSRKEYLLKRGYVAFKEREVDFLLI